MVAVQKKDGSVRLCIDPKPLNKALKRNHYPHPDIEDLLPNLAKVFSVVDAKNGFWHVQLDQESSYLTTFATPWGRYRWKRMPFGISPAPEEFQRYLDLALEGLEGIKEICDDILVCGVGESYEEAVQDHDNKLVSLLERCRSKGIKLNSKKLLFRRNQVSFMGHLITSKGLRLDPAKVEAIQKMPIPSNKQAVRRLLGMVNYLQRFSPNLSSVTAPLRELLKEQNVFHWREDVEGKCFSEVKKILSSPPLLKYFDPFAREFEFEHITSSPGYPKSNGKSENAVRTAKRLVKKAKESGRDPYLSLLDWRNTPSEGVGYSPAQRLLCRRTRTLIPTAKNLLKSTIPKGVDRKLLEQKSKQAFYYNKGTKELSELKEGDLVRIKPLKLAEKRKPWLQAKVEGKVDIRSYQVRTEDGRVYRRNRQHLRHSREQPEESTTAFDFQPPFIETSATRDSVEQSSQGHVVSQPPSDQPQPEVEGDSAEQQTSMKTTPVMLDGQQRTRSGRVVRKPCRYQDYGT